ncbi:uncharacterized protein K452DRAFT_287180 [Aplosporella prunicola CBS 121167]|uniref:Uncharacterized protein n=1 Tax=Aplosporella prunicola CBS 121167 TaxID=1176127 RepID=A0A6A6BFA0_9PEZI|nr:uncharacterized protein K452DRAFT_287180 [Aplosporella prunicola CBS 121167]KAF2141985.1 hypothetical protein K452DRAFT_287180 [Aplosporella prunicola CBS 121167]
MPIPILDPLPLPCCIVACGLGLAILRAHPHRHSPPAKHKLPDLPTHPALVRDPSSLCLRPVQSNPPSSYSQFTTYGTSLASSPTISSVLACAQKQNPNSAKKRR